MQIKIELTEQDLKRIIKNHIASKVDHRIDERKISILVKSKQNFKSEWEEAAFKAEYSETT